MIVKIFWIQREWGLGRPFWQKPEQFNLCLFTFPFLLYDFGAKSLIIDLLTEKVYQYCIHMLSEFFTYLDVSIIIIFRTEKQKGRTWGKRFVISQIFTVQYLYYTFCGLTYQRAPDTKYKVFIQQFCHWQLSSHNAVKYNILMFIIVYRNMIVFCYCDMWFWWILLCVYKNPSI